MTKGREIRGDTVWCLRSHGLLILLLLHHNYFAEYTVLFMFSLDCKTCKIGFVNNFARFPWMESFLLSLLLKSSLFSFSFWGGASCLWKLQDTEASFEGNLVKLFSFLPPPQLLKSPFQQMSLEESLSWLSLAFYIENNEMFPMLRQLWSVLKLKVCPK